MLPGRERSPRRQQFSWMQQNQGPRANTDTVLPATQLQWSPPNFGVLQPVRMPGCGKGACGGFGNAGNAGFGAQCDYGPYRPPVQHSSHVRAPPVMPGSFQPHGNAMSGKGTSVPGQVQQLPVGSPSHSPMSTFGPPLPTNFRGDAMFLDTSLVGGLPLPRFVKTSDFTRRKGIAGCPASAVPIHALLHHGWSSWWLRRLCDGKECYLGMFKDVAEVVFAHSLFQALRSNHVSLDAIAEHVSRQDGQTGDRTWCSGVLATKVAEYIQSLQPQQNQDSERVAALQSQIQDLQKQVAAQQRAASGMVSPVLSSPHEGTNQRAAPLGTVLPDSASPGPSGVQAGGNTTEQHQEKMQSSLTAFFSKPEVVAAADGNSGAAASAPPGGSQDSVAPSAEPAFGTVEHVQQVMDKPKPEFLSKKWVQMKNDKEVKDWISKLKLTKVKSTELQNWIQSVQTWFDSLSPGAQAKLDNQAVLWGVPVREISKLKQEPLLKVVAVASKMSL